MKGSRAGLQIISSWNQDALRVLARGPVSSEGWHHVFVTYDGSRKAKGVRIYYDGKPQSVYEEVDSLRGSIRTKTPLRLNRRSTGEGAGGAAVHDVRFYRRVLTTPEVQVLARRGVLEAALAAPPAARTQELLQPLRDYYFAFVDADARRLQNARDTLVDEFEAVKSRSKVTLIAEEKKGEALRADSRAGPVRPGGRQGRRRRPGDPPAPARRGARQPPGTGAVADPAGPSAHRPRQRQPLLGAGLRPGARLDRRGVRRHRRASGEPETARLAGRGVPRVGMEREGPLPADGDVRRLPPVRGRDAERSWRRTPTIACSRGGRASGCTAR